MTKIYLGKVRDDFKENFVSGEKIYLEMHSWDCNWYYGMGYIGNRNLHTHFDITFLNNDSSYDIKDIFEKTPLTQSQWWLLRDLFIQAYALRKCAEVYRNGGHQTSKKGITDIIENSEMENKLNADLKIVLDMIWDVLQQKN